jgi:hypothetical protein
MITVGVTALDVRHHSRRAGWHQPCSGHVAGAVALGRFGARFRGAGGVVARAFAGELSTERKSRRC